MEILATCHLSVLISMGEVMTSELGLLFGGLGYADTQIDQK